MSTPNDPYINQCCLRPIHITDERVEEYRALVLALHGETIEPVKARQELSDLVSLIQIVNCHLQKQDCSDLPLDLDSPTVISQEE